MAQPTPEEIWAKFRSLDNPNNTAYDVLEIPFTAEAVYRPDIQEHIHAQFRALARRFHPDRNNADPQMRQNCNEIMTKINGAYDALRTEERRLDYNVAVGAAVHFADMRGGQPGSVNAMLLHGTYGRILEAVSSVGEFNCTLPKIVVVGAESSGKSSTLERVAMRSAFPRAEEFCTRMPISMKLRYSRHENRVTFQHVRVLQDGRRERIGEEHRMEPRQGSYGTQDSINSEHISQRIRELVRRVHPNDTGRSILVDEEIEINIHAPNVPTLDLVDLPGLVSVPEETRVASEALTRRYISDPNTLVLCVLSARVETLRSSLILRIMDEVSRTSPRRQNHPSLWHRTILILSKVDEEPRRLAQRLQPGAGELADFHAQQVVPVINRGHGSAASLVDALEAERRWFHDFCNANPGFAPGDMGIPGVLMHVSRLIDSHMRDHWVPTETARLRAMRDEVQRELLALGADPAGMHLAEILDAVRQRAVQLATDTDAEYWRWTDSVHEAYPRDQWTAKQQEMHTMLTQSGRGDFAGSPFGGAGAPAAPAFGVHMPRGGDQFAASMAAEWNAEHFLDRKLSGHVVDTLSAVLRAAMAERRLPHKLDRFTRLRDALVSRARSSLSLRESTVRTRERVRYISVRGIDSRDLLHIVLHHNVLFALQDDHGELFARGGLGGLLVEDEWHQKRRQDLTSARVDKIENAIAVLMQLVSS